MGCDDQRNEGFFGTDWEWKGLENKHNLEHCRRQGCWKGFNTEGRCENLRQDESGGGRREEDVGWQERWKQEGGVGLGLQKQPEGLRGTVKIRTRTRQLLLTWIPEERIFVCVRMAINTEQLTHLHPPSFPLVLQFAERDTPHIHLDAETFSFCNHFHRSVYDCRQRCRRSISRLTAW